MTARRILKWGQSWVNKKYRQSADCAICGICGAVVKAQQPPVKATLDEDNLKKQDSHDQWLRQEKQKFADHDKHQKPWITLSLFSYSLTQK